MLAGYKRDIAALVKRFAVDHATSTAFDGFKQLWRAVHARCVTF